MISEKLILTPYLFKKKINDEEFIGNLLNNKCFIKNTEKIESILNYFTELKFIPEQFNMHMELIERLIKARILVTEKNLILPFPNIELEITNHCNSSCTICPRSQLSRKKGFMSEETFNTIIDQLKEYTVSEVEICGVGEPLLHRNAAQYIKRLKDIGIKRVKMVTNASLLTVDKAKDLALSGLDTIMISFHTIYEDKYSRMMKGLDYNKVLENIKNFINTYSKNVEIIITAVVSNDNLDEIQEFKVFWKSLGADNIYFQNIQSRAGNLNEVKITIDKSKCPVMDQGLFITFDGNYLSCSNDFTGKSSWANVNEMSFSKCLDYKLNKMRNQTLFEFCKYCDYDFHKHRYLDTNFHKYVAYKEVEK